MATEHYDVVIIGSGAGGGTLAWKLAPSGKRILLLERGDYLPRERDNWDTVAVFLRSKYTTTEQWLDRDDDEFTPEQNYYVGGNTKFYGAALFRLRPEDFGEITPSRRHLARVAARLRRLRAVVRAGREPLPRAREGGGRPDRGCAQRSVSVSRGAARAAHPAAPRRPREARASPVAPAARCDARPGRRRRRHPLEPLHPVRSGRRLPVPGRRQGRRADGVRRSGARALERRPHHERARRSARDRRVGAADHRGRDHDRPTAPSSRFSGDVVVVSCGALNSALLLLRSANDTAPERARQRLRPGRAATTCATTTSR